MKKNQYITLLFCLFSAFVWPQSDSTTVINNEISIEMISNDSLSEQTILPQIEVHERKMPQNFKNKYSDDEFVYETALEEKNWWSRLKEKIALFFKNLFNLSSQKDSVELVDLILKIIAVLIIIVVVFLIVKSILNKEGQWIFGKTSDKKILKIEDVERNLHLVDFEKLIQETLKKGDSRLAIRYYYLWLLKKMTEKNIIEWDLEKTNSDYVYEIKSQTLKEKFIYLSYLYNNVWYGAFDIEANTFERMKTDFIITLKSIES